jgi:hypothetical protein
VRPVLPEALLKRMQAAVDAARASRDREQPGRATAGTPTPDAAMPETAMPETAASGAATPALPVQIWPAAQNSPAVPAVPPVANPPVTSPPVTSPPVTIPPDNERPTTGQVLPAHAPVRPAPRQPRRRGRRGPRVAGAAALAVVLFAAGAVAATLWTRASGAPHGTRPHSTPPHTTAPSTPPSSPPPSSPSPSLATVRASIAARWVVSQVSHDDLVACDRAMCAALAAHGFPGSKLRLIRPKAPYPLQAQVVVVTPQVARQFGSSFAAKWAPAVLSRVGFGAPAIYIRIVASKGAAAYNSALSKDVQQRKASAQHLLGSAQVKVTPAARNELSQGQVDARLIVVLTALASVHPIEILGFGTNFAGASPRIPLRVAYLARYDAASRMKWTDYPRFLLRTLAAQPTTFRPQSAGLIRGAVNNLVFRIEFSAPSPLGIVGP